MFNIKSEDFAVICFLVMLIKDTNADTHRDTHTDRHTDKHTHRSNAKYVIFGLSKSIKISTSKI